MFTLYFTFLLTIIKVNFMKILNFIKVKKPSSSLSTVQPVPSALADAILAETVKQHKEHNNTTAIKKALANVRAGKNAPTSTGRTHIALQQIREALIEEFTENPLYFINTAAKKPFVDMFAKTLLHSYGETTLCQGITQTYPEVGYVIAYKQITLRTDDPNNQPLFSGIYANIFPCPKAKVALAKAEVSLLLTPHSVHSPDDAYSKLLVKGETMIELAAIQSGTHHEQCFALAKMFSYQLAAKYYDRPRTFTVMEGKIQQHLSELFENPEYIKERSDGQLTLTPKGMDYLDCALENRLTSQKATQKKVRSL